MQGTQFKLNYLKVCSASGPGPPANNYFHVWLQNKNKPNPEEADVFLAPHGVGDRGGRTAEQELHWHLYYKQVQREEDSVTLKGHLVWGKCQDEGRDMRSVVVTAKAYGDHWTVTAALGNETQDCGGRNRETYRDVLLPSLDLLEQFIREILTDTYYERVDEYEDRTARA